MGRNGIITPLQDYQLSGLELPVLFIFYRFCSLDIWCFTISLCFFNSNSTLFFFRSNFPRNEARPEMPISFTSQLENELA